MSVAWKPAGLWVCSLDSGPALALDPRVASYCIRGYMIPTQKPEALKVQG